MVNIFSEKAEEFWAAAVALDIMNGSSTHFAGQDDMDLAMSTFDPIKDGFVKAAQSGADQIIAENRWFRNFLASVNAPKKKTAPFAGIDMGEFDNDSMNAVMKKLEEYIVGIFEKSGHELKLAKVVGSAVRSLQMMPIVAKLLMKHGVIFKKS